HVGGELLAGVEEVAVTVEVGPGVQEAGGGRVDGDGGAGAGEEGRLIVRDRDAREGDAVLVAGARGEAVGGGGGEGGGAGVLAGDHERDRAGRVLDADGVGAAVGGRALVDQVDGVCPLVQDDLEGDRAAGGAGVEAHAGPLNDELAAADGAHRRVLD